MCYMSTCPNERDMILHIISDDYPSLKKAHCDTDCYNKKCVSYHWGENNKEKAKPVKKSTEPPIREDAWWCGYCPGCGQLLSYNYADSDRDNRKQYCWHCGQLVEFEISTQK